MLMALFMLLCVQQSFALTIDAEVDRTEVGFGESLNLVVTLTQDLGSGRTQTFSLPRIGSIPGFDIASTRSGQSTSFINGVGSARTQVQYELVPQESGKFTIPAFSFADGSGQTHSTKAIEITVLPPPAQAGAEDSAPPTSPAPESGEKGSNFFTMLLVAGLLLAAVIAPILVLSAVFNRRNPSAGSDQDKTAVNGMENAIEDAEIVAAATFSAPLRRSVDFAAEVARLKRQHPEADKAFYQEYFQLFGKAALAGSCNLSESMTSDEMLARASAMCNSETARQACHRLSGDIEMTLYANRQPARAFAPIDADAREIINAIMQ